MRQPVGNYRKARKPLRARAGQTQKLIELNAPESLSRPVQPGGKSRKCTHRCAENGARPHGRYFGGLPRKPCVSLPGRRRPRPWVKELDRLRAFLLASWYNSYPAQRDGSVKHHSRVDYGLRRRPAGR
jgi:hypothetical protein